MSWIWGLWSPEYISGERAPRRRQQLYVTINLWLSSSCFCSHYIHWTKLKNFKLKFVFFLAQANESQKPKFVSKKWASKKTSSKIKILDFEKMCETQKPPKFVWKKENFMNLSYFDLFYFFLCVFWWIWIRLCPLNTSNLT